MPEASDCRRLAVVAVALAVLVGFAVPAGAASGSVTVDAAIDSGSESTTMQFTFTAPSNGTITNADEPSTGDVSFAFDDRLPFSVSAGEQYTVSYTATADQSASGGTYSESVGLYYSDGSTATTEPLDLTVTEAEPQFGSVRVSDAPVDVVFTSSGAQTRSVSLDVPNTGNGAMVPEDVSFDTPSGISVSVESMPSRIDGNREGTIDLEVTVDRNAPTGTTQVTGTVQDNLGTSGGGFSFDVDVSKPPVAGVPGGTVDVGDVLVGSSTTTSFEVSEQGGFTGLDGLQTSGGSDADGSISFDTSGFSTSAGGSDTAEVTISANSDAPQHETLRFTTDLSGVDSDSPATSTTFEARVIYPATLENVDALINTFEFDEPRTVSAQQAETTVRFDNGGDLEMDVQSVDASVSDSRIQARVTDVSSTVQGQSSGDATVQLAADPSTPEGTYTLDVRVETADAGTETISQEFEVDHGTDLAVGESDVGFGEVTITERRTRTIDVGEALGYNDLSNVEIERVDGPDRWLEVTEQPPGSISAGEAAPLVYQLRFDTDAEAYQEYTWTFEVSATGVETETITVSAVARLLSPEAIISDLDEQAGAGGWQATTAESTTGALESMESRLREGESFSNGDIQRTLAVGQSTVVLIDSVESAQQLQSEGNYEAAQREVISALIARNMIEQYAANIEDEETAAAFTRSAEASADPVASIVDEQQSHYESVLESDDATALERHFASDNLAELARQRGNGDRAAEYESTAESSFEEYQQQVSTGVNRRTEAMNAHESFTDNATLTVLGQPLVLNPARIDEVNAHAASVSGDLQAAENAFRAAGATGEAEAVAQTRSDVGTELTILRYALYGATVLFAVLFLLFVVREVLNARTFIQESREATAGDFLL
ncbi:hypothetical protein [Halopenitus persicus]|uniref:Uncharacterized protein n=1 Tax=Halopenitus persicus TaxID=1048396 RepID=A0A1H3MRQ8_9EURY|nr:hypothetical protein [Halopenitus persicus]SDY79296.1 hypothetical protein SAMN05216564_11057 [Halopenitus persicus]